MFYLLDPEKWERQKHFEYYMQMIPCESIRKEDLVTLM